MWLPCAPAPDAAVEFFCAAHHDALLCATSELNNGRVACRNLPPVGPALILPIPIMQKTKCSLAAT